MIAPGLSSEQKTDLVLCLFDRLLDTRDDAARRSGPIARPAELPEELQDHAASRVRISFSDSLRVLSVRFGNLQLRVQFEQVEIRARDVADQCRDHRLPVLFGGQ